MISIELLKAKDAIFRLIEQFHHANKSDDGELYIYDYCESALERAFDVLGIKEDHIKLIDFCKMWEKNNRAIWAINMPDKPFGGITAETYYDIFKNNYIFWEKQLDEIAEENEETKTSVTTVTKEEFHENMTAKKCGMCKKYTGLGDWNLCCTEKHDPAKFPLGHLCYADTPACEKFKPVDKLTKKEFYDKYCMMCGSQRCEGIGTVWFDGCHHRYELEGYTEEN